MSVRIIIVARAASGKDFLRKKMEERGFFYCIPYTTRPCRDNETNNEDYHFVSDEFFIENRESFYEILEYNGWKYGIMKKDFYNPNINLYIMTPESISLLSLKERSNSFIIYLNPDPDIIRERLSKRNDADSAIRRMEADNKDFADFNNYDIMIKNADF